MLRIHELSKSNTNYIEQLKLGRQIFMTYFLALYKDLNSKTIQIESDIKSYLTIIFNKTESDLRDQDNLYAILVYLQNIPIGFCTFGSLENSKIILIRTLPINLDYKSIELDIRNNCINFTQQRLANCTEAIIMVRKANVHHQEIVLKSGFIKDEFVFDKSNYIKKTYNSDHYIGYVKKF